MGTLNELVYEAMADDDVEARTIDAVLAAVPSGWIKTGDEWLTIRAWSIQENDE